MEKVKAFFNINGAYRFEWNDLRAAATVLNVILIILFGLSIAWLGLGIAVVGLIKDFTTDRRINGIIMHLASMVLNIYFLTLLYCGQGNNTPIFYFDCVIYNIQLRSAQIIYNYKLNCQKIYYFIYQKVLTIKKIYVIISITKENKGE